MAQAAHVPDPGYQYSTAAQDVPYQHQLPEHELAKREAFKSDPDAARHYAVTGIHPTEREQSS